MHRLANIFVFLLLTGLSAFIHAADPLVVSGRLERQDLASYLVALEDSAGRWTSGKRGASLLPAHSLR
jgi:hypothetical protein